MGIECTKVSHDRLSWQHGYKIDALQTEMRRSKEKLYFSINISNLRLTCSPKSFHSIKIQHSDDFQILVPFSDFSFYSNFLQSHKSYSAQFKALADQLETKILSFVVQDRLGNPLEILKMKLNHLCTGPVHHDHLLKVVKSRILFDLHIDQTLFVELACKKFHLQFKDESRLQDFCLSMSLGFEDNRIKTIGQIKKFQVPSKELVIKKFQIKNTHIQESIIKLKVFKVVLDANSDEESYQFFIPYSKIMESNSFNIITLDQTIFQQRKILFKQKLVLNNEDIGQFSFTLEYLKSKLYVQQMECVILSENGIVMTAPSDSITKGEYLNYTNVEKYLKRIRKIIQLKNMPQRELFSFLEDLYMNIARGRFNLFEQTFETQISLLDLLYELAYLIDGDEELKNQCIWNLINQITRNEILTLRYFHSLQKEDQRIQFALRFYKFMMLTLRKIMKFTQSGITFKQIICIQKFIAFTYFRFPWCQEEILSVLTDPKDPKISQEKLAEIGASYALKSPSKSYIYDWEGSVYSLVKGKQQFRKEFVLLQFAKRANSQWAKLLFDREYQQLFYGLYTQLWNEAQIFLNNNGRTMWQYFPHYGELLSIFLGQMNRSQVIDYSDEMTKCNIKLIKNQKLLNTFMILIFPKTCLYETYCVIKCLDLIECYFSVYLSKKKKLPLDFHFTYFYTAIRCIFESNHYLMLQKALSILYKYYSIFTDDFKDILKDYIIGKVFHQLFLHWCKHVRSIFHLLLIFKFMDHQNHENPEINLRKIRSHFEKDEIRDHFEILIDQLSYLKRKEDKNKVKIEEKMTYHQKMYENLKLKKLKSKQMKQISTSKDLQSRSDNFLIRNNSLSEKPTPNYVKNRKWSLNQIYQANSGPTASELKYLSVSLEEYEKEKGQTNPDQRVLEKSKMLQIIIDQ